jgi:hypothetical protein
VRELVHTRESINRAAVDVKPGNPFLTWLHRADPTSQGLTLADSQREPQVYLVPEYVDEREVLIFVARKLIQIFEEHLYHWYPRTRSLAATSILRWYTFCGYS